MVLTCARLTEDDNEDVVAALLGESEPKGEKSDHDKDHAT